jgi:VanZ family protein
LPVVTQNERPEASASLKHTGRSLFRNWWPAVAWVCVILTESTDMASSRNTDGLLYKVISTVAPRIDPAFVELLNEVLRKTGHFLGYGVLSVLVFFALKNTNRDRLRRLLQRPWGIYLRDLWRLEWSFIAVMSALGMATYDEIHQTFIPSRTGRWQDVVIDTSGAIAMQVVVYLLATRKLKRSGKAMPQPEPSSVR